MPEFIDQWCPYCGERIELCVDEVADDQRYVEDCAVCCKPMQVLVRASDGETLVELRRDDEA